MTRLTDLADAIIQGDHLRAGALTRAAITEGMAPKTILDDGLIAGMTVVGDRFREHEIFLPDVLLAARAMYAGMDLLKPLLIQEGVPAMGTVVIGTVRGDLHDIGKNLVGIMLRGAGFRVVDLGIDQEPESFVRAAAQHGASVIAMSALLTTTMPVMGRVVERLRDEGLHGEIRTLVGGAPLSEAFARTIGADAYAADAYSAVETVRRLADVG